MSAVAVAKDVFAKRGITPEQLNAIVQNISLQKYTFAPNGTTRVVIPWTPPPTEPNVAGRLDVSIVPRFPVTKLQSTSR